MMLEQAIRIFAVAPVFRAARWLHVRGAPRFRTERAQKRRGVRCTGADFHVVGLQERAALAAPVVLQRQNELLKGRHRALAKSPQIFQKALILPAFFVWPPKPHLCRSPVDSSPVESPAPRGEHR